MLKIFWTVVKQSALVLVLMGYCPELYATSSQVNYAYQTPAMLPNGENKCLQTLLQPSGVLSQLPASETDTALFLDWGRLTMASAESAIARGTEALKEFDLQKSQSPELFSEKNHQLWRVKAKSILAQLTESEIVLRASLKEVQQKFERESLILSQAEAHTKLVAGSSPEIQALKLRQISLMEIKNGLEETLQANFRLFLFLRNRYDLDHPYLHNKKLILSEDVQEVFPLDKVNRGSQPLEKSKGEVASVQGWLFQQDHWNPKYQQLFSFEGVSLTALQELSVLSREQRLNQLTFGEEVWSETRKAFSKYLPYLDENQSIIGKTIELNHFPFASSPPGTFTVEKANNWPDWVKLTHGNGKPTEIYPETLIHLQIKKAVLSDIRALIKSNKTPLIFELQERYFVRPVVVTKVSMSEERLFVVPVVPRKVEHREILGYWISYSQIEGVPLSIDTSSFVWIGPHKQRPSVRIGSILSINSSKSTRPQVIPLSVETSDYYNQWFFKVSREAAFDYIPGVNQPKSLPKAPSNQLFANSFMNRMDRLRINLEGSGFYGPRSMDFVRTVKAQTNLYSEYSQKLNQTVQKIKDYKHPTFLNNLKKPSRLIESYNAGLAELPGLLGQAQWLLTLQRNSCEEASLLIREILTSAQQYQNVLPQFQKAQSEQDALASLVLSFLNERLLLFAKLAKTLNEAQVELTLQTVKLQEAVELTQSLMPQLNRQPLLASNYINLGFDKPESLWIKGIIFDDQTQSTLNDFFNMDVATIAKNYSARPEDFRTTLALNQVMKDWENFLKEDGSKMPISTHLIIPKYQSESLVLNLQKLENGQVIYFVSSQPSQSGSPTLFSDMKNLLLKIRQNNLTLEFIDFMKKKGGLYHPAGDELLFTYNQALEEFVGINRRGQIRKIPLNQAGLFWEPLGSKFEVSAPNEPTMSYVGRGATLTGEIMYVYRELENHEQKLAADYRMKVLKGAGTLAHLYPKGSPIPSTPFISEQMYLLVHAEVSKILKEEIQNLIKSKARLGLPNTRFLPLPDAVEEKLGFFGRARSVNVEDQSMQFDPPDKQFFSPLPLLKPSEFKTIVAIPALEPGMSAFNEALPLVMEDLESQSTKVLLIARLPKEIYSGATVILTKSQSPYLVGNPYQIQLVLDSDFN